MPINWELILAAGVDYDTQTKPAGLYAPEETKADKSAVAKTQALWEGFLSPALKSLGCTGRKAAYAALQSGRFHFMGPDGNPGDIQLVHCSKIKVRKYGNLYRIDPHADFSERWKNADLELKIKAVWKYRRITSSSYDVLLFIGFASESRPYYEQLQALELETAWRQKPIHFMERQWPDPHGRHFNTYMALWVIEPHNNKSRFD